MCDQEDMKEIVKDENNTILNNDEVNKSFNNDNNNNNCLSSEVSLPSEQFISQVDSMIRDFKEKRSQDIEDQTQFRKKLHDWADESSSRICSNMVNMIDSKSVIINNKFEEICGSIKRVQDLEEELDQFKNKIEFLFKGISGKPPI